MLKPWNDPVLADRGVAGHDGSKSVAYPAKTVTDGKLRVHGVAGLRICDASVFGRPVVGHTDGPTRMVGANCARMLMQEYK